MASTGDEDVNERALKHLLDERLLRRMAKSIALAEPSFNQKHFIKLMPQLDKLELKARVQFLRGELHRQLPTDFPHAVSVLLQSAADGSLSGFDLWPYTEFVQTYGLDHLQLSLNALKELTRRFTSEFAVRPFLKRYPLETLAFLQACANDEDVHLRRWASEGSRPRLPWGERLHDFVRDPSPTFPILEQLKHDPELYVRKSVANHLNDVAKDHPELVIKLLARWKKSARQENVARIDWIIRRALRNLIKSGHAGALALIDVAADAKVELVSFKLKQKKIKIGERVDFELEIVSRSSSAQKLVVDYIVHFVKANQTTAGKVFKLKTVALPAKGRLHLNKSHHFKKITTREYYPGAHILAIQINGAVLGQRQLLIESY